MAQKFSALSGAEVTIEKATFHLSGPRIELEKLKFMDPLRADRVQFEIEAIRMDLEWPALLRNRLVVKDSVANGVHLNALQPPLMPKADQESLVSAPSVRSLALVSSLSLAFTITACNFNKQKVAAENETAGPITAADLNYANLNSKVFEPYCLSCHSVAAGNRAGVNLESYETVMGQLELVQATAVVERSMPPNGSSQLSPGAYALLKAWLEAGAPR